MKNIYYKNIVNLYKTILNSFIYFYWLETRVILKIQDKLQSYLNSNKQDDEIIKEIYYLLSRLGVCERDFNIELHINTSISTILSKIK
jgi:hypothetical protein